MNNNNVEAYQHMLEKAAQFIKDNDDFLVLAHLNPDGDAIGSSLATMHLLRSLGKKVHVVNEGECPKRFSFLPGFEEIIDLSKISLNRSFSAVISVDVADEKRFGKIGSVIADDAQILNIDHHPTNTNFGVLNVIQPTAASTTEILFDLITAHFSPQLDSPTANALYTGLLTDTGGFRYANTKQSVLDMAAKLLGYGVQPDQIADYALETVTASHIELLKYALQSLSFHYEGQVAIILVSQEDMKAAGASKDDVDGISSYPRKIEGVEVGALFKEWSEGEVKVSLRSNKYVDVALLAQRNGGGGHAKASGYTFNGNLQAAKEDLLNQLKDIIQK
ncbi:DHH family phosphoesterase [Bacillus horti]|nr:bifunctional oligoribonuclease/PAP phosphatase NrnA [Bacillus horti]